MKLALSFITSTIGRKYLMALSGLALVGFVIIHMIGNLKIYSGADAINHYAHLLKYNPVILWSFRFGLLGIALVHVVTAISLIMENRAARPKDYEKQRTIQASLGSVTMALSGLTVLAFVIYHILHFTVGAFHPEYHLMKTTIHGADHAVFQLLAPVEEGAKYHDVYRMMVSGFQNVWISAFYVISMAFLCLHMSHGISSMFQSLGLRSPQSAPFLKLIAWGTSAIIFIGMSSIPISVLAGWVK
jgi:succinate dehydrogenase / fumarate reductase cytochrome b subunit